MNRHLLFLLASLLLAGAFLLYRNATLGALAELRYRLVTGEDDQD